MKDREIGLSKAMIGISVLAITLSAFILATAPGVIGLSKFEWTKWFLFASWILFLLAILASVIALMFKLGEGGMNIVVAEAETDEEKDVAVLASEDSSTTGFLYAALGAIGAGSLFMVVFFCFMLATQLKTGTGL